MVRINYENYKYEIYDIKENVKHGYDIKWSPSFEKTLINFDETIIILATDKLGEYIAGIEEDYSKKHKFKTIEINVPLLEVVTFDMWIDDNSGAFHASGGEYCNNYIFDLKSNKIFTIGNTTYLPFDDNYFKTQIDNYKQGINFKPSGFREFKAIDSLIVKAKL